MPSYNDLILLSNVWTNILVEADKAGIIEFNREDLKYGAIGVSAGDEFGYKVSSAYHGSYAHTGFNGNLIGTQVDIQFYDKDRKYVGPHLKHLHHAGNVINMLGYHEVNLHGKEGIPPSKHLEIYRRQKLHESFKLTTPEYQNEVNEHIKTLEKPKK